MNNFITKVKSSDFTFNGHLSNYLPYVIKGETLKGHFTLTSDQVNLNEFMAAGRK